MKEPMQRPETNHWTQNANTQYLEQQLHNVEIQQNNNHKHLQGLEEEVSKLQLAIDYRINNIKDLMWNEAYILNDLFDEGCDIWEYCIVPQSTDCRGERAWAAGQ